jgi:hypothetical protein
MFRPTMCPSTGTQDTNVSKLCIYKRISVYLCAFVGTTIVYKGTAFRRQVTTYHVSNSFLAWRRVPNLSPQCKVKGKVHPRTGHEGPEGKQRDSSTLSLTSALDGVGSQRHAPAALPPGKEILYPLYRTLGRPQGRSGRMRKTSPPPGFFFLY